MCVWLVVYVCVCVCVCVCVDRLRVFCYFTKICEVHQKISVNYNLQRASERGSKIGRNRREGGQARERGGGEMEKSRREKDRERERERERYTHTHGRREHARQEVHTHHTSSHSSFPAHTPCSRAAKATDLR